MRKQWTGESDGSGVKLSNLSVPSARPRKSDK